MRPAALLLAAVVAFSAAPAAAAFSPGEWKHYREVRLPLPNPKGYYYLRADPEVFRFANPSLSDLRLIDGRGREVSYVLEVRNEEPRWDRYLPQVSREGKDVILDLGRDDLQHNQVLLITPATNFRGRAAVFASDDGEEWRPLARDLMVFDHSGQVHASSLRLDYPVTTCRFLKLSFALDRGEIAAPGAEVMMVRTIAAEYQELEAIDYSCAPDPEQNDTVCRLRLRNLPVSRITIAAPDEGFFRSARALDRQGRELASTCLYRYRDRELTRENLSLTLNETQAEELTLRIRNFDDQPLAVSSIRAATTARDLVFRAGPGDGLRLFLGNPAARPPVYDLRLLMNRVRPEPRPVWAELGPVERNPAFVAPPPPAPPREQLLDYSDLMWPFLLFAALVLGWLIVSSARQMRGETQDTKPPDDRVN